jgi:tetratricopeptide (TPR) repeat protein
MNFLNLFKNLFKKFFEKYETFKLREETAEDYLNEGIEFYDNCLYDQAITAFTNAIKINPKLDEAFIGRGTAYTHKGMLDLAISDFNQAIKINPQNHKAYTGRACIYGYKGLIDQAISDNSKAIKLNPYHAPAYYSRALSYVKKREFDKAWEDFCKAESLGIKAPSEIIEVIEKASGKRITQTKPGLPRQQPPSSGQALLEQGEKFYKAGDYEKAAETFKQAIRLKPDFAEAHACLGAVYLVLGRNQEAVDHLKQAILLKPDLAEAHTDLGAVYYGLGRYQKAIEPLKQAIRLKPDNARAHACLGMVYVKLGNRDAALEEYKILQPLDPKMSEGLFKWIIMIWDLEFGMFEKIKRVPYVKIIEKYIRKYNEDKLMVLALQYLSNMPENVQMDVAKIIETYLFSFLMAMATIQADCENALILIMKIMKASGMGDLIDKYDKDKLNRDEKIFIMTLFRVISLSHAHLASKNKEFRKLLGIKKGLFLR